MDGNLLTLIVTVILFLIGQVIANIVVLARISTRVTRVETHILHLMQHKNIELWRHEQPPDYEPPS